MADGDRQTESYRRNERIAHFRRGCAAAVAIGLIATAVSGGYLLPIANCCVEPIAAERICPNTAPPASLMRLPGVGRVRARDIVADRKSQPFGNADEMERIRGIGPVTVEKIRPFLKFEERGQKSEDRG